MIRILRGNDIRLRWSTRYDLTGMTPDVKAVGPTGAFALTDCFVEQRTDGMSDIVCPINSGVLPCGMYSLQATWLGTDLSMRFLTFQNAIYIVPDEILTDIDVQLSSIAIDTGSGVPEGPYIILSTYEAGFTAEGMPIEFYLRSNIPWTIEPAGSGDDSGGGGGEGGDTPGGGDEPGGDTPGGDDEDDPYITVSPSSVTLAASGDDEEFAVTSNIPWTITQS